MTRPLADDWVSANPVQRLATEVIKSAIADATRGDADAQVFLDDSDALRWWATVRRGRRGCDRQSVLGDARQVGPRHSVELSAVANGSKYRVVAIAQSCALIN